MISPKALMVRTKSAISRRSPSHASEANPRLEEEQRRLDELKQVLRVKEQHRTKFKG